MFKVGDRIKLKDYTKFSDYRANENKVGIIKEIKKTNDPRPYHIEWIEPDEKWKVSWVSKANMVYPIDIEKIKVGLDRAEKFLKEYVEKRR
jgi:hypothetical protein